jgi:hypothetical protein
MAKKAKTKMKARRSRAASGSMENPFSGLSSHPAMFWFILILSLLVGIILARWGLHFVAVLLAGIIIFIDTWRRGQGGQPSGLFGKANNYNFMLASGALMVIVSLTQLVKFAK